MLVKSIAQAAHVQNIAFLRLSDLVALASRPEEFNPMCLGLGSAPPAPTIEQLVVQEQRGLILLSDQPLRIASHHHPGIVTIAAAGSTWPAIQSPSAAASAPMPKPHLKAVSILVGPVTTTVNGLSNRCSAGATTISSPLLAALMASCQQRRQQF